MNLLTKNNLIRLVALVVFLGSLILVYSLKDSFYFLFVLIALIAFCVTFISKNVEYEIIQRDFQFKKLKNKAYKFSSTNFIWLFPLCLWLIFLASLTNSNARAYYKQSIKTIFPNTEFFFDKPINDVKIIPTPLSSPTPFPIHTEPTARPTIYVNPDPIVNCGPGQNSGQYIKDKQSNCNNYVDCGFNNNVWTMMLKTDCDKKQAEGSQNNNQQQSGISSNKVPVFLSYYGYTFNCPSQNVGAVQSINSTMESKKSQWASDFNSCYSNMQKTDSCYSACTDIQNIERSNCSNSDYANCSAKTSENWLACTSNCPSLTSKCDWVYSESNSLSNQITNLCK